MAYFTVGLFERRREGKEGLNRAIMLQLLRKNARKRAIIVV